MKILLRIATAASVAVVLLAAVVPAAQAAVQRKLRYARPPGAAPQDGPGVLGPGGATRLRGIIDQTLSPQQIGLLSGELLTAAVNHNVPGCGVPTVSTSNDTFLVIWPLACVFPGDAVTMDLSTTGTAIIPIRQYYANALGDSIAPAIAGDLLPGSNPLLIASLTGLLALAGGAVLVRRRRAAAARIG